MEIPAQRRSESERVVDLDHAATTRLRPEAHAAMEPFLTDRYGNPSGAHATARDAVRALDEAREQVAEHLGCAPGEVVFTSGGTEADVHAVSGGLPPRSGVPICPSTEHHSVLATVDALGGTVLSVDRAGRIDLDDLRTRLARLRTAAAEETGPGPSVVSVMLANNELGTINDLDAVADVLADVAPGVPLHTDAVQAAPWLDVRERAAAADMVSISAHKFGGPRGSGVLVVRDRVDIAPLLHGGGQERGRRSGTVDVAGAVGLAAALAVTVADRRATAERVAGLRNDLLSRITAAPFAVRSTLGATGWPPPSGDDPDEVLPNFAHVLVADVDPEPLMFLLDAAGVRASSASSCSSGALRPSHVLSAIAAAGAGVEGAALRLTLGPETTADDVDHAVAALQAVIGRLRHHRSNPVVPGVAPDGSVPAVPTAGGTAVASGAGHS
ncbi:MAG: cysteine desulfurase family protein [Actinomycetota bacterium]